MPATIKTNAATLPAAPGWNIATFRHSEEGEHADCFSFEPITEFEILRIDPPRFVVLPITAAGRANYDSSGPFAIKSPDGKFESSLAGVCSDEQAALEAFRNIFVDKAKPAAKRRQRQLAKGSTATTVAQQGEVQ